MKKNNSSLLLAFVACCLLSSCGTIIPKKQGVKLFNYTDNVTLKVDGKTEHAEQVLMASKEYLNGAGSVLYYGAGVEIDRRHPHTLTLEKNGKTVDIKMKSKVWGLIVVVDLFTSGPIGLAIDGATGNWRHLKPKYVDVTYAFGESKKKSHGKLKRQFKRKFKKHK